MEAPCQYTWWKQQLRLKCPVSAASSIAGNNLFSNLPVEGREDVLEDEDGNYTAIDSESESGSEGDKVEITNKEAHTTFIPLGTFTNCNSFWLADSLPRKIVTEKTQIKKSKSKKWKAARSGLTSTV